MIRNIRTWMWMTVGLTAFPMSLPAQVTMLQPVGVTTNMGQTLGPPTLMIDQSGLSSSYTSGVTNFDTYLASNPTHNSTLTTGWESGFAITTGNVDFDLGSSVTVSRMASGISLVKQVRVLQSRGSPCLQTTIQPSAVRSISVRLRQYRENQPMPAPCRCFPSREQVPNSSGCRSIPTMVPSLVQASVKWLSEQAAPLFPNHQLSFWWVSPQWHQQLSHGDAFDTTMKLYRWLSKTKSGMVDCNRAVRRF